MCRIPKQANARTGGGYIGGGIDWALTNNWIIGAEYRHYVYRRRLKRVHRTGKVCPEHGHRAGAAQLQI